MIMIWKYRVWLKSSGFWKTIFKITSYNEADWLYYCDDKIRYELTLWKDKQFIFENSREANLFEKLIYIFLIWPINV